KRLNDRYGPEQSADPKQFLVPPDWLVASQLDPKTETQRADHCRQGTRGDQDPLNTVTVGLGRAVEDHSVAAGVVYPQRGDAGDGQRREQDKALRWIDLGEADQAECLDHQTKDDVRLAMAESEEGEPIRHRSGEKLEHERKQRRGLDVGGSGWGNCRGFQIE